MIYDLIFELSAVRSMSSTSTHTHIHTNAGRSHCVSPLIYNVFYTTLKSQRFESCVCVNLNGSCFIYTSSLAYYTYVYLQEMVLLTKT